MSKTGTTLLFALFLVLASGVFNKAFAAQKLNTLTLGEAKKSYTCSTPLESLLTLRSDKCEAKVIPQKDSAAKLESKNPNSFSYSLEPTYYVPTPTAVATSTIPTVSPSIQPATTQTPTNNLPSDGINNNSDVIFDLINAHRAKIGKAAFQKDGPLCQLAVTRSLELHGELFEGKGYLHSGLYNRNLPYWITENAKYGSNEAGTVQWWLNSRIHRAAIEGNHTFSCGACNGTQCSQLFTSYTPKTGAIASNVAQTVEIVK